MNVFESIDVLEDKEQKLKQAIHALSDDERKVFYKIQSGNIKDPDTYAALTWLCVGGIHHLYLGRYRLFAVEISFVILAIMLFIFGFHAAGVSIIVLFAVIELPQLFMSQKIVRLRNYEISDGIYQQIKK